MEPYADLPGISLGPHDSIVLLGEGKDMDPHWWHHADYPLGREVKGEPCVLSIKTHKFYDYGTSDAPIYSRLVGHSKAEKVIRSGNFGITPSIVCTSCGRHIFVRGGRASTFGNAHSKWDEEQRKKRVATYE